MKRTFLDGIRWWLGEQLAIIPGVLRYDDLTPLGNARYVNRINGHVVIR